MHPRFNQNTSKEPAKNYIKTIAGVNIVREKITSEDAYEISNFARRALYWGDEVINPHFT